MVEQFGKGLLIILLHFVKLVQQFLLFPLVLQFKGSVLENLQDHVLWLFLQKDVTDAEKSC
jgi:hypothetical protein